MEEKDLEFLKLIETKNRRIEELETAISRALAIRDLWGVPDDISHIEESDIGEYQAVQSMEYEFVLVMDKKIA